MLAAWLLNMQYPFVMVSFENEKALLNNDWFDSQYMTQNLYIVLNGIEAACKHACEFI